MVDYGIEGDWMRDCRFVEPQGRKLVTGDSSFWN